MVNRYTYTHSFHNILYFRVTSLSQRPDVVENGDIVINVAVFVLSSWVLYINNNKGDGKFVFFTSYRII